jgi:hypothetical protein
MSNELNRVAMSIVCKCGQKMILHVGLTPDTSQNVVACLGCRQRIVALVPGPVVAGPFPASA